MVGISASYDPIVKCYCKRCKAEGDIDVLRGGGKLQRTIEGYSEVTVEDDKLKCACGHNAFIIVIKFSSSCLDP